MAPDATWLAGVPHRNNALAACLAACLCPALPFPPAADFNLEEKLQPDKGAGGSGGDEEEEEEEEEEEDDDEGDSLDREAAAREELDPQEWEES